MDKPRLQEKSQELERKKKLIGTSGSASDVEADVAVETTGKTEELNFKALSSIEEMTDNVRKL